VSSVEEEAQTRRLSAAVHALSWSLLWAHPAVYSGVSLLSSVEEEAETLRLSAAVHALSWSLLWASTNDIRMSGC